MVQLHLWEVEVKIANDNQYGPTRLFHVLAEREKDAAEHLKMWLRDEEGQKVELYASRLIRGPFTNGSILGECLDPTPDGGF